jgi:pilus assembly protein FimV
MNRSLKLSMLVALALGSSQVLALDMGQIQVKSALWQPLLAEIPISSATPAELKGLTVQLASNEDFARAGIIGGRTNVPLSFSVVNSGGRQVIRITSTVPVNDPYLDLLLEVNDHAGKSVREFAILLDPPNSTPGASVAAASPARSAAPVRQARTTPSAASTAAPAPAPHPRHPAAEPKSDDATAGAGKGKYGPVESGQTLSSIAHSTAPGVGVSMNQMLIALKQANPDAFYRDNINALKRGAILRIPTTAEAQTLAAAAAVAEVQRQNSDWRAGRVGKSTTVADTATRAPASGAASSASNSAADRLALVSAADQQGSNGRGGRVGGQGDQSSAGLRQELQRTKESLASAQQQSNDLKTRLQDLNDINSKNERLLSLKDSEIADLQNKLAAARKTAGLPAQPAPVVAVAPIVPAKAASVAAKPPAAAAVAGTAVAPIAGTSASSASPAASSSVKPAPVAAAPAPAVTKPSAVITPTPAPVADEPWYMQTWAWAAGAGAVVVLVLLALLARRRRAAAEVEAGSASLADRFGSESIGHDPSDIDQNELLDQLAEHPDDIGLHLELVTLYYSRRDVDHFEAAAEAMHAHITDTNQDEWQDVLHMGEDLAPNHPLFDHHVVLPPQDVNEARRAFDIDHYASDDVFSDFDAPAAKTPSAMPPLPPTKMVSEYHFNFDASEPDRPNVTGEAPEAIVPLDKASEPDSHAELSPAVPAKSAPSFTFEEPAPVHPAHEHVDSHGLGLDEFNDDPVDTKLDLARAYVDMGDADGARAMLGEVMKEGTQIQQDVARRLLETLH